MATASPCLPVLVKLRKRSVGNGKVAALIVKRNDIVGRVDSPRVFISCGVAIPERIVAIPIGVRKLASGNGGAQDKRRREQDAFIGLVNFHRGLKESASGEEIRRDDTHSMSRPAMW